MGRGRAKAKQTKVARDLKYRTYSTDFSSLERELRGVQGHVGPSDASSDADPYDEDESDLYDDVPGYDDEDDDDEDDDYPRAAGTAAR